MSVYSPRILDRGLNAAIIHLCNKLNPRGYSVSSEAPEDFDALKADFALYGRLCVSDANSDNTIFGDPEVNYAFRAWHDACHLLGNFNFTLEGETAACELQCEQLVALYGAAKAARWCAIIRAEVTGQASYVAQWGVFPVDQFQFDHEYLVDPRGALALRPEYYAG